MTLSNSEKLEILYKSKILKEMCLEDLEIWNGFDKIYPSYIRFPEMLEFNNGGFLWRKEAIKELKKILKRVNNHIKVLHGNQNIKVKRDPLITLELNEQKKRLEIHLIALRKMRDERKKEFTKSQSEVKG